MNSSVNRPVGGRDCRGAGRSELLRQKQGERAGSVSDGTQQEFPERPPLTPIDENPADTSSVNPAEGGKMSPQQPGKVRTRSQEPNEPAVAQPIGEKLAAPVSRTEPSRMQPANATESEQPNKEPQRQPPGAGVGPALPAAVLLAGGAGCL